MSRTTPAIPVKSPLHERIRVLGFFREKARSALFRFLGKLAETDDAKRIQYAALRNLLPRRALLTAPRTAVADLPYGDLGNAHGVTDPALRDDVILISARFRSGSTLLWNLFRNLQSCTAYYEPLNERRWFDPAMRGERTDPTHKGVSDYWREYDGLADLGQVYNERWIDTNLLMDADSWDPGLKRYVSRLIEAAPGRPVLQFNRIDFRLPWFRRHFPNARIMHLYRHPREQWASSLVDVKGVPLKVRPAEFMKYDHYYLLNWARDLKYYFPFLDEESAAHPYQLFYYIWKLSFLFGQEYAHFSLAFEDLVEQPRATLARLLQAAGIADAPLERLASLIEKPRSGRWRSYASDAWYQDQEAHCEAVMADFFRAGASH